MAASNKEEEEEEEEEENPETLVFPPKNHENLHISTSCSSVTDTSSTTSSSTFSISHWDDTSAPTSPIKNFNNDDLIPNLGFWDFSNLGLELMLNKFNGFMTFLKKIGVFYFRGVLLILRSPIGFLLVFLYLRWRRRMRTMAVEFPDGGNQHLIRVIREKDERINELLKQIARMNEVLLSKHKAPSSNGG